MPRMSKEKISVMRKLMPYIIEMVDEIIDSEVILPEFLASHSDPDDAEEYMVEFMEDLSMRLEDAVETEIKKTTKISTSFI